MSRRLVFRLALIATIALASLVAGASSAFASTYCVGVQDATCTGPVQDTTEAGINAAFTAVGTDPDSHSAVLISSLLPITITTGVSLVTSHPVDITGVALAGAQPTLQMTGAGSLLSVNSSGSGNTRSTISGIHLAATSSGGALRAVRVNNVDVHDCTIDLTRSSGSPIGLVAQGPTSSHHLTINQHNGVGAAAYIDAADAEINDSTITGDDNSSEGFIQSDTGTHTYRRNHFVSITDPIEVVQGTALVQDSLIDLGSVMNATAAQASSAGDADGLVAVKLEGTTVVGTGDGQLGLYSSSYDSAKPTDASADSTIIDLKGSLTQAAFCSTNSFGIANLELTYSLIPLAAEKFDTTTCTNATVNTATDIDMATHPPIYAGPGDYRPAVGSPVVDAGNPGAIRLFGSKDLVGNARIFSDSGTPRIDIGAYEKGPTPPAPLAGGGATTPDTPATISFTKPTCKFKIDKKAKNGFVAHAAKDKGCTLKAKSSAAHSYMFRLERVALGYLVGGTCKAKQGKSGKAKRCNLPLKGSQMIDLPSGTSYLSFGARWNNKQLPAGTYKLNAINPNSMPNRISMNLTVAKQGSSGRTK